MLYVLFFFVANLFLAATSYGQIEYKLINHGDLREEEDIFVKSFCRNIPSESSEKLDKILALVREIFQEERNILNTQEEKIYFVQARQDEKVIGFISFNKADNNNEVNIRTWAVDHHYWGRGVAEGLIFGIKRILPETEKLLVTTRKINERAQDFLIKRCGFKQIDNVHEKLVAQYFISYEWQGDIEKKLEEITPPKNFALAANQIINEAPIEYEWITQGDLREEEEIFVKSFCYKTPYEESSEKLDRILVLARELFQEERDILNAQQEKIYFVRACQDGKVAGFASFNEASDDKEINIRVIGVDSQYWRKGIGENLIFAISHILPETKKIVLKTREISGFKCNDGHEGVLLVSRVGQSNKNLSSVAETKLTYEWVNYVDLCEKDEEVWLKAFSRAYKNLTPSMLGLDEKTNMDEWLRYAFKRTKEKLGSAEKQAYFLRALDGEKVVGFAFFENTECSDTIYINSLCIDPMYAGLGIGKKLVFLIGTLLPETKQLVVVIRKVNYLAQNFYLYKCGFEQSDYVHKDHCPEHWDGYKWQGDIKKKLEEIELITD